jgi:enterochelin esterase family protein
MADLGGHHPHRVAANIDGRVTGHILFVAAADSIYRKRKIFPGTARDYLVYVPADYDGAKPACVMIFQDGSGFVKEDGAWRSPIVFDDLIHQGAMPVTIGIFIDPGVTGNRYNRSYDGLWRPLCALSPRRDLAGSREALQALKQSERPCHCRQQFGCIAAFTAAWERPDAFRRVLSFVGSLPICAAAIATSI